MECVTVNRIVTRNGLLRPTALPLARVDRTPLLRIAWVPVARGGAVGCAVQLAARELGYHTAHWPRLLRRCRIVISSKVPLTTHTS